MRAILLDIHSAQPQVIELTKEQMTDWRNTAAHALGLSHPGHVMRTVLDFVPALDQTSQIPVHLFCAKPSALTEKMKSRHTITASRGLQYDGEVPVLGSTLIVKRDVTHGYAIDFTDKDICDLRAGFRTFHTPKRGDFGRLHLHEVRSSH